MQTERIAAASCALGMLAYTGIVSLLPAPDAAGAGGAGGGGAPPADTIKLTGVVRDFRRAHPDFNSFPSGGFGHVAGNLELQLGADQRPVFAGGGFRVDEQWMNRYNQPIAPHLYVAPASDVIPLLVSPQIAGTSELDTWDSSAGNYGGSNVGPAPSFEIGAAIPAVFEPAGLGPSVGDLVSWPPGPIVLSEDVHCDRLIVGAGRTVRIDGQVTILCEKDLILGEDVRLDLLAGASLRIYFRQSLQIGEDADVNKNTHDPSRLLVFNLGVRDLHMGEDANLYARVVSPGGELRLAEHADFYGTFAGESLQLAEHADFHLDLAPPLDPCGAAYEDREGVAGQMSQGGITSAATFAQWYSDVPGVNLSALHAITLTRGEDGEYAFETDDFHPIDGQLFGNEGDAHNYYFTYVIDAMFVYDRCAGQLFAFEGDDDVWVFIDGKLVVDCAGLKPDMAQFVEMDRLDLAEGQLCRFRLFHAQRQNLSSRFKLKTNIAFLSSDQIASLTAPFD